MLRPLATLALAGALTLTTLAEATPRQRPRLAPRTFLSHEEQVCEAFGEFAYARAGDRDGGIPMMRMLALSRQYDAENGAIPWHVRMHEAIIRDIYAQPTVSPAGARQAVEVFCLEGVTRAQALAGVKDR